MKNIFTLLHFLRCLLFSALALVSTTGAWAANYKDLVGNSFEGWYLQYGALDVSEADHVGYYFDETEAQSHWQSAHNLGWTVGSGEISGLFGTINGSQVETQGVQLSSGLTNNTNLPQSQYRFYRYTDNTEADNMFTGAGTIPKIPVMPECVDGGANYTSSIRVGNNSRDDCHGGAEFERISYEKDYMTAADRVYYDFKVTDEYQLLKVNFCPVLKNPAGHTGAPSAVPSYSVILWELDDSGNKVKAITGCSGQTKTSQQILADIESGKGGYKWNTKVSTNGNCGSYDWVTSGWQSGLYNLNDEALKGKTLRLEVSVHDCVYDASHAGSHYSYVYFTARLLPVKLDVKYCTSTDSVILKAPNYFDGYSWNFGNTNSDLASNYPENAVKKYGYYFKPGDFSTNYENVKLILSIEGADACTYEVDTTIKQSKLTAKIQEIPSCRNNVTLTDGSTYVNDNPGQYKWYIFKNNDALGSYANGGEISLLSDLDPAKNSNAVYDAQSAEKSVSQVFNPNGQYAKLVITSEMGCKDSTFSYVIPNIVANWSKEKVSVCENTQLALTFVNPDVTNRDGYFSSSNPVGGSTGADDWFDYPYAADYSAAEQGLKFFVDDAATPLASGYPALQPVVIDDAITPAGAYSFKYTVEDKYGCQYEGTYSAYVNPEPKLYFDANQVYTTDPNTGAVTFYVCPGSKAQVKVYSYVANEFTSNVPDYVSTTGADELTGYKATTQTGSKYECPVVDFPVGTYYWRGKNSTGCTSTLTFNVAYYSDSVTVEWPDPVCPFDDYDVTCVNFDKASNPTWYAFDPADLSTKLLIGSGANYVISQPGLHPDYIYHCYALDSHGCTYDKEYTPNVSEANIAVLNFPKWDADGVQHGNIDLTSTDVQVPATGDLVQKYDLGKLCEGEGFSFNITSFSGSSAAQISRVEYEYYTSADPTLVRKTGNGQKLTLDEIITVSASTKLVVYLTATPYDVNGNQLCASKYEFTITGYSDVILNNLVNGAYQSAAFVCEGDAVTLTVEPKFADNSTASPAEDYFSIIWDGLSGTSTDQGKFSITYNGNLSDATSEGKLGHYFNSLYTVTTKTGSCSFTDSFAIYVSPIPSINAEAQPEAVCQGAGTVTVTGEDRAEDLGLTSSLRYDDATVYKWTFVDPSGNSYSSTTSNSRVFRNQSGGDYKVIATTKAGCSAEVTAKNKAVTMPDLAVYVIPYYNNNGNKVQHEVTDDPATTATVCQGNLYKLLVVDKNNNTSGSSICEDSATVTVRRLNAPYNTFSWTEYYGDVEQTLSNKTLSHVLNFIQSSYSTSNTYASCDAALFSYYTAGSSSDLYEITYTTACGCSVTRSIEIPVVAVPALSLKTDNSDFICQDDNNKKIKISADTESLDTDLTKYNYYWVKDWRNAGDQIAATSSLLIKTNNNTDDAYLTADFINSGKYDSNSLGDTYIEVTNVDVSGSYSKSWTLNVEEKATGCLGKASISIYSQVAPEFTLEAEPTSICENAKTTTEIKLKATPSAATASHTNKIYYFNYNKSGSAWNASSWGADVDTASVIYNDYVIENAGTYGTDDGTYQSAQLTTNADNQICVRAGEAYIYSAAQYRTTSSAYFCYSTECVTVGTSAVPEIQYEVYSGSTLVGRYNVDDPANPGSKLADITPSVCAGSDYTIQLVNKKIGVTDAFTLTNLADSRAEDKTVSNGSIATFGSYTADASNARDRYRVKLESSDGCSSTLDIVVSIVQVPVVKIAPVSGSMTNDTIQYCAGGKGVDIRATVTNANVNATYDYVWKRDGVTVNSSYYTVGDGVSVTTYSTLPEAKASDASETTYATYTAYVSTSNGCEAEPVSVTMQRNLLPSMSLDTWLGCSNGNTTIRFYETDPNKEEKADLDANKVQFTPTRDYHVYACTYDVSNIAKPEERLTSVTRQDVASISTWKYYSCGGWSGTVCNSPRMYADMIIPMGESYRDAMANGNPYSPTFYYVEAVDKTTGCASYRVYSYDPLDSPDPDSVYIAINFGKAVNTESQNLTKLSSYGNGSVIANACPGDLIYLQISDRTKYNPEKYAVKYYESQATDGKVSYNAAGNMSGWSNYRSEYSLFRLYNATTNSYSGWSTASASSRQTLGISFASGLTVPSASDYQLQMRQTSSDDRCYGYGEFRIDVPDAPTLTYLRDHACVYDMDGNYDGTLKFRAVSTAQYKVTQSAADPSKNDSTKIDHTYSWYDATNTSALFGYDASQDVNNPDMNVDTFWIQPCADANTALNVLKTASSKQYQYYLHDKADGYCSSTNIPVYATLYMNPQYDLSVDVAQGCEGDSFKVTVAQDVNYALNTWQYYYWGQTVTGSAFSSQYNYALDNKNYPNYSHSFSQWRTFDQGTQTIDVICTINYNPTMTYDLTTSSTARYLHCFTKKSIDVTAFETPKPVLSLVTSSASGLYDADERILEVSVANTNNIDPDQTTERRICPGADYTLKVSNSQERAYTTQNEYTTYTISDLTEGVEQFAVAQGLVPNSVDGEVQFSGVYTTDDHKYSISAVSEHGCKSNTLNYQIPVADVPVVTITSGNGATCKKTGETITLLANASKGYPFTYQWYDGEVAARAITGATSASYVAEPTTSDNEPYVKDEHWYTVRVTNASECTADTSVKINVWPLPQFTVASVPAASCEGKTVKLNMQKDVAEENYGDDKTFVYSWVNLNNNAVIGSAAAADEVVSSSELTVNSGTQYTVQAMVKTDDGISCTDQKIVDVDIRKQPSISYKVFKKTESGSTELTDLTTQMLCPDDEYYIVLQNENPDVNCNEDNFFLKNNSTGEVTQLVAAASTDAEASTNQNGQYFKISANTTYTCYIETGCGCSSAKKFFTVYLAPTPTVSVTGPTTFCASDASTGIELTATAASNMTWKWSTGDEDNIASTSTKLRVYPTATTTYTAYATSSAYGCVGQKDFTVTALPNPVVSIDNSSSSVVCEGAYADVKVDVSSSPVTVNSVMWQITDDNNVVNRASGESIQTLLNSKSTFVATATGENGCTAKTDDYTVDIAMIPDPSVDIYTSAGIVDLANNRLCPGQEYYPVFYDANSSANSSNCSTTTYYFSSSSVDDEFTTSAATPANESGAKTYTMGGNVTYRYYAVSSCSGNSCQSAVKTVSIQQAAAPVISVSASRANFCDGFDGSITLTANATGVTIDTYTWDAPATQDATNPNVATVSGLKYNSASPELTYRVTATTNYGCSGVGTVSVTGLPKPTFEIDAKDVCNNSVATLSVTDESTEILSYLWYNDNPVTNTTVSAVSTSKSYSTVLTRKDTFYAQVKSTNGCTSDYVSKEVNSIDLPLIDSITIYSSTGTRIDSTADGSYLICAGSQFYPVFHVHGQAECNTVDVTVTRGANASTNTGTPGNDLKGDIYTVDGNGTYYYSITSSCGCKGATKSFYVQMAQQPTVSIVNKSTNKNTFCEGTTDKITLSAQSTSGVASYMWSANTGKTGDDLKQAAVELIPAATTYSVDIVTDKGCPGHADFTMSQLARPDVSISGPDAVCSGAKVSLSASVQSNSSDIISYTWADKNNTSASFASVATISADVTSSPSTYTLSVMDNNGCTSEVAEKEVYVNDNPTITFIYSGGKDASSWTVCDGNLLSIKPSAGYSSAVIKWYTDGAHTTLVDPAVNTSVKSIEDDGTLIVLPTTANTRYYVTVEANGCVGQGSANSVSVANPVVNYDGNTKLCVGDDLVLKGLGTDLTFRFGGDATDYDANQEWTMSNVAYSLNNEPVHIVATNKAGCSSEDDINITVNKAPEFEINGTRSVCENSTAVLTASAIGSSDNDDLTYVWKSKDGSTETILSSSATLTTERLQIPSAASAASYDYYITVKSTSTQCSAEDVVEVSVNKKPVLELLNTNVNNSIDKIVQFCQNEDGTDLFVTGAATYVWDSKVTGSALRADGSDSARVNPTYLTTYTVTGYSADNCESQLDVVVRPMAAPSVKLVAQDAVCNGNSVTATAWVGSSSAQLDGYSYSWNRGDINNKTNQYSENIYSATDIVVTVIESTTGCSASASKTVEAYDNPVATINADYTRVCQDSIVNLSATVNGGETPYYYTWTTNSNSAYSASADKISPRITVWNDANGAKQTATDYNLIVRDNHGCVSRNETVTVTAQEQVVIENTETTTFCEGTDVTLNMVNANEYCYNYEKDADGNYVWTDNTRPSFAYGVGNKTINVVGRLPLDNTTNRYCLTAPIAVQVKVVSAPVVTWDASTSKQVCEGASAVAKVNITGLSSSDADAADIVWVSDPTMSGSNPITIQDVRADHKFIVTVTDKNSLCYTTTESDVTVYQRPRVKASGLGYVCQGSYAELTAEPTDGGTNYTYDWTRADGTLSHDNPYRPLLSGSDAEVFTLVATDDHNCQSDKVSVSVNVQPSFTISNNGVTSYCEDKTSGTADIVLKLSGASTGYYTINNEVLVDENNEYTNEFTDAAKAPGDYYYYVYGYLPLVGTGGSTGVAQQYCQSSLQQIVASVHAAPSVLIEGSTEQCKGTAFNLTAKVGSLTADANGDTYPKYVWNLGSAYDGQDNIKPVINSTTNVILTVTDELSKCSREATAQLTVYDVPSVSIDYGASSIICQDMSAELSAVATPSGTYQYYWSDDQGHTWSQSSIYPTVNKDNVKYSVYVEEAHGANLTCRSEAASQTLSMQKKPVLKVSGSESLCQGDQLNLVFAGANEYYVDDVLVPGSQFQDNLTEAKTYRYTIVGVDYISGTTETCVSNDTVIERTPNSKPTILVSGSRQICEGGLLELSATAAYSGTAADPKYTWNTKGLENYPDDYSDATLAGTAVPGNVLLLYPSGASTGSYDYQVSFTTGADGCSADEFINVTTLASPVFSITSSDPGICSGKLLTLTATPADGQENTDKWNYSWSGGNLAGAVGSPIQTIVDAATYFTATATNASGCKADQTIYIRQYDLPSVVLYYSKLSENHLIRNYYKPDSSPAIDLCESDNITFYAQPTTYSPGITDYDWDSKASVTDVYTPVYNSGKVNNVHTLYVTSTNGCVSSENIEVTLQQAPSVSISTKTQYCYDDTITLTGQGADTYEWPHFLDDQGKAITTPVYDKLIANKLGESTYTLYGYNSKGCRNVATATINVVANPEAYITSDNDFLCFGEKADLTVVPQRAGSDYQYSWSSGETSLTIYPIAPNVGNNDYFVTITDNNTSCQSVVYHTIVANANPSISISSPAVPITACSGQELAIRATGADEMYWTYGSVEDDGPFTESDELITAPTSTTTYKVTGVNTYYGAAGQEAICEATKSFNVTVYQTPSIQLVGKDVICYGDDVNLTANGLNGYAGNEYDPVSGDLTYGYSWSVDASKIGSPENTMTDQFTAATGASVSYSVTGIDKNGCSATVRKDITMRPKTVINIKAPSTVCQNSVAGLKVVSDANIVSYRWSTSEMGDTISHVLTATADANGDLTPDHYSYSVTATDENSCQVTESVDIALQKELTLTPGQPSYTTCSGSQVSLTVGGASKYIWDNNPSRQSSSLTVSPINDTIHTVVGTLGVCSASVEIPVYVATAPVVSIEGDLSVCMNQPLNLSSYCNTNNVEYNWSTHANLEAYDTKEAKSAAGEYLTTNTKVSLLVTDLTTGCQAQDTVTVVVNNLPNITISGDLTPCANSFTELEAGGASSYLWTNSLNSAKVQGTSYSPSVSTSEFDVTVTGYDANGCSNSTTTTIVPTARPVFTITAEQNPLCQNDAMQLSVNNETTACSYVWSENDEVIKESGTTLRQTRSVAGTYLISVEGTLKTKPGCSTIVNTPVYVRSLPELYITGNDYPCQNTTLTVQAHGADSYQWWTSGSDTDDGNGLYTHNVTSASPFNVRLTGTKLYTADNNLQCSSDTTFTFQVHAAPLVTINGDQQSCMDGMVTLTATSPNATTFNWGSDGAGATINPVITEDRTVLNNNPFKVTVFDAYGCEGSATHEVEVIPSPSIYLYYTADNAEEKAVEGNIIEVCENDDLKLRVSGGKSYLWTEGINTWDGQEYEVPSTEVNRSFSIVAYSGNCETSENYKINIKLKPTAWVDGSTNACQNENVTLKAMGADHYVWTGIPGSSVFTSDGNTVANANDSVSYAMVYDSVAYNVQAFGANGCYININDTLTYTPIPDLFYEYEENVCVGDVKKFRIINPDTDSYIYVWNDNFSDTVYNYRATTPDAIDTIKVEAKVKGIGGCSNVKYITVYNRPQPTLDYTATGSYVTDDHSNNIVSVCANTDLQIAASGARTYQFVIDDDTTTATRVAVTPDADNVYTVIGTDRYGCVGNMDVVVKALAAPVVYSPTYGVPDANGDIDLSICLNDKVTLDVNGADTYEWYDGSALRNVEVQPTLDRSYSVTGKKTSNGCPTTINFNVHINSLPDILITDNNGKTGRDNICIDDKFVLRATPNDPADSTFKSFVWRDEDNNVLSYRDSLVDYSEQDAKYSVTVTDVNRCSNTASFSVKAVKAPTLYVETNLDNNSTVVCSGSSISLYGRTEDDGYGANTYTWMLNADTVSNTASYTVSPKSDLTFTYSGVNKYGCSSTMDVPVSIALAPTIWVDGYGVNSDSVTASGRTVNVSDTITICKYQDLLLSMMGDADSYLWPNNTTSSTYTLENVQMTQNFSVTGVNNNGCKSQLLIPIVVLPSAPLAIKYEQNVCDGTITTLAVDADADAYDNYLWSNNMLGESTQVVVKRYTDENGMAVTDTTVSVTGYNSATGCSNTVKALINIKELPTLEYEVVNSSNADNSSTTFCLSDQVTIYAKGANQYVWQDGTEGDAFVNMPKSTDILKVIGTLDGCSDSLFIPVTILTAPVIWADGLKPICKGDTAKLTAKGAATYEWSDGTKTAEFKATPADTTTYVLTGTATNGCKSTIDVPVIVRQLPTVTIEGSPYVCINSATDLTAVIESKVTVADGTGNSYRWFVDDEVVSTQAVLNHVIENKKTAIKLVGSDPAGCSSTATININGQDIPVIKLSGSDTICAGQETAVFASGASSYEWVSGKDTLTGNLLKVSPTSDVVYNLTATSSSNCKADTLVYITVNQLPDVNVLGNASACVGGEVSLTGTGAVSYKWSNGQTGEAFTVAPLATSKYTVTGTDENGCSNKFEFTVTVNELPKFNVNVQPSTCVGLRDSMNAAPVDPADDYSFYWTTASGISLSGDTVAPVLNQTTEVVVKAIDNNTGCQAEESYDVQVFDMPELSYVGSDSVCLSEQVWLIAQNADTKSYVWTANGDTISTDPELRFTPSGSTTVVLSGAIQNCRTSIKVPVTVVAPPYLYIATKRDTLCRGSEMTLQALGADSYVWEDGSTDAERTVAPVKSTVYSIVGTNKYGCVDSIKKTITVIDIPTIKISASKNYVCPNQVDSVKFSVSSASNIQEYTWSSVPYMYDIDRFADQTDFTAIINDTTTVYVTGTDDAGCVGVDSFIVYERPQIDLKFNVNPSCVDNDSRKVRLTGMQPESATWIWDMGDGRDTVMGEIATYMYELPLQDSFLVSVHTVDAYGCLYDGESYIYKWRDFWAPEAFSPNSDGLNDKFHFRGGDFIEEFHFVVYDRLGEIVFEGDDINDAWDGTYKGKACAQGVYGWTATYSSSSNNLSKSGKRKGYITIIR